MWPALTYVLLFQMKSIYVASNDTARDCIRLALKALDVTESSDSSEFQLWVRTRADEAPYPLIGHEIPLIIKLHWTRMAFNSRSQKSYDEYKAGCRCSFILRYRRDKSIPLNISVIRYLFPCITTQRAFTKWNLSN